MGQQRNVIKAASILKELLSVAFPDPIISDLKPYTIPLSDHVMIKLLLTLLFAGGLILHSFGQAVTNYSFSAFSGTFTNLTGATAPSLTSGNTNDGYFNGLPIGFDFWYMGTRYTTLSASTNGWLTLGASITNSTPTNNLTSGGTPRPVIAPLWDDLNIQSASNVSYRTAGTVGSRVFTIQYLNVKWQNGAAGNTISFQIKLNESTGEIEFQYRQETGALNVPSASIGIAAVATGSGQFLSINNTGATVSSTTEASVISKPVSGNTYSFNPPVPHTPTSLIFTTVNNTSMTLNWSDLSSNDVGFVIYRSTDGVNYAFVTQTAANTTSSIQSGLTANTLYYWRVYSVSEGGLSATALSGSQTAACTPPVAPVVTSPINYCQGAIASALTATGTNLSWGAASGTAGGTATLTTAVYIDNAFNNRKTNFTTNAANIKINSVDYYIPAFQSVSGLVLSIYNSGGTIIATSSTTTSVSADATPVRISNLFNYTIPTAGNYSIGVSAGTGNIGTDNPAFPISEQTGTIDITGVSSAGNRAFNNIQFVNPSSAVAPVPSTSAVGSTVYLVSQTIGGCTSPQASITVNVTAPAISQIPTSNFIANYKFTGDASDETGNNNGTFQNSPAPTTDRYNHAANAMNFNGTTQYVSTAVAYTNPLNFTISIWFKTNTATGGRLIGFGTAQTGLSGQYDRHLYMNNSGQIYFGVYPNAVQTVNSIASYNDNLWHLATATLSSTSGMSLYMDGALVASNAAVTSSENYTGYWRIGYDNNNAWTSQPSSFYFSGTLDDVLIYHEALSALQVATLYTSPDGAGNNGPACVGSALALTATTVSGATYSWTGPNGFTSNVQNPTITYATAYAGVYTLQVTVNGCSTTAYTSVSTSTNAGQWTGNLSTDWNTAGNWCTGIIPTATTNVVISATAIRMPTISSAAAARNITIQAGATLTTVLGGTFSIAGTLINSGTMTNNGTTLFNGTTGQQTFSGVTSFTNLTVNNTNGLLLPNAISVINTLTLTAGTLTANNFNIGVGGNWINTTSAVAFTAGTGTVTFNGATPQTISGTFSTTFNNLTIANTGSTLTLGVNASIAGNLTVSSGTFDLSTFTANRTATGGMMTVANNATLKIGGTNTFPINYTTITLVVASTVEYSGANQTVSNQIYGNLALSSSSGAAVKTFPGAALSVVGNLIASPGSGTSVLFTAASAISVGGNVTLAASTAFNGGSFVHSIGGNWTNNGTFTGNTSTIIFTGSGTIVGGSGTQNFNNLTVAASPVSFSASGITLTGHLATTGAGSFTQAPGGTLTMSGVSKTITGSGISLDNLTISGSVSATASLTLTGNLSVAGTFAASAGTLTMSGTTKTISGAGTISFSILSVSGSITTTSTFSISAGLTVSGSFSASAGTTTFTGTSTLSGTANLYNATINGTSLQLAAGSALGIASTLTVTSGTLNATSSTPNTVNFNGTGTQTVNALIYSNLQFSNGSTKTAAGNLDVRNNMTLGTSTTFNPSTFTHSIYGDWINNGTFTASSSTIQFLGAATSSIIGATTFNILTSNTSGASTELILQSNVSAATVHMTNGIINTGSNTLTLTTTRTGNGFIYGNIQRTHAFSAGTSYAFEGPDNTIIFSGSTSVTSVTVSVVLGTVSDFPSGASISRYYNINSITGTYTSATLRLHYEDNELNGNDESTMGLWHYSSPLWSPVGKASNSTVNNYIEQSGLTTITSRWTASGTANVVLWDGSASSDWNTAANWTPATVPISTDIVYLGTGTFTNNPTISNSVTIKNILFGDAQAITLSMASGGSLTTGDITGNWTAPTTHTINTNNQTITINGDLYLSDGTAGHLINLNIGTGTVLVHGSLHQQGNASIVFSGTGNLGISNDFEYVSGTFIPGTGTVTYDGTVNQNIGHVNHYHLTVNKSSGLASINNTLSVGGNLIISSGELDNYASTTIAGDVTLSSGAILQNSSTLQVGGNWNNLGSYVSNGSVTNVIFNGAGSQTISSTTFGNLEINKPVGSIATLTGAVTLKGDLVGTSGTLDIQSFFFNRDVIGGTAILGNNGTLIIAADNAPNKFANYSLAPNSTVIFNGNTTQHLLLPGVIYGNITFRNSGTKILYTPITVSNKLHIETGATFDGGAGNTITLNGDWQNDGTFTPTSSNILCAGATKNIIGNTTFYQMTVTGSYTILNNVTYNGLLNITNTGSLSGGDTILTTLHGDLINSGTLYTLGTTSFSGNVLQTLSLINAIQTVAVSVNFNGSVSPVLNSTSTPQYGYLNINNSGGVNPSVDWNILYALTVGSGASFNSGPTTQNIFGAVTNNGTITSSGIINLLPAAAAAINLGSSFTSTGRVVFGGAGAITLSGPAISFYNAVVSNTHVSGVTPAANWSMNHDFTLNSGSTFHAGPHTYSVSRNFTSNGTFNSSTSAFTFNGSGAQGIQTLSPFNHLTVNNATGPVTLISNVSVNGILNFVAGQITTNSNKIIQSSSGTVTNASQATGWVNGIIQKATGTGAVSKTFEVGDAVNYTPVTMAFSNITTAGDLTASTTAADHPALSSSSINPSKSVNRYWSLTNMGVAFSSYTITSNWVASDLDAGVNTSTFKAELYNAGSWTFPLTNTPASTSLQASGVTLTGDIAIGENCNAGTTIAYALSPYCSSGGTATTTVTGSGGGTYSSAAGLSLNASTGDINLAATIPGSYVVTYTVAASDGCPVFITSANVTISPAPASTISYPGTPYCSSAGTAAVTLIGTSGGAFSAPTGLIINSTSGLVDLDASTAGTYTVTYSIPAANGCAPYFTTTSITITTQPFANGSYEGNPYCATGGFASPTGTAEGQPGTVSSTTGLSIDSQTGVVDLGASVPGSYTVTYFVPASAGCSAFSSTSTVAITAAHSAIISYAATPYCTTATNAGVTFSGTTGGTYSSNGIGLSINGLTGTISPSSSSGGTYEVTYTMAADNGCPTATATTEVIITDVADALISYAGSPYLIGGGNAGVSINETFPSTGIYSSTAGLVIDSATGDVDLNTSTASTYMVTYTVPASGGCSFYATTTSITINYNLKVWDGGAGTTLWSDANNWDTDGVPTAFDNINLTSATTITIDIAATANLLTLNNASLSLIIAPGGSLALEDDLTIQAGTLNANGNEISLGGDWINNGTFTTSTSTVTFDGATTQTIAGSSVSPFHHITVTNIANPGVQVQTNQNLHGILNLATNVHFDADGSNNTSVFTLISGGDQPTADAAIGILPSGAQVTGNVTVQRFMTKEGRDNTRIYRYISSPIQNATVADIQNEIPVTGSFAGTSVCSGCVANQSLFSYQESIITDVNGSGIADYNDGYIDFPANTNTEIFLPGRGYSLFTRGNLLASTLWNVRGMVNTGNNSAVTLPVTYTSSAQSNDDGWNLVGNPFPSTINWNAAAGWTKTNIDGAIYISDNGSATALQYATWNGVTGTNGGSRFISTAQGFWVRSNGLGTPVLSADENVKSPGQQTIFFREGSPDNLLRVTLVKASVRDEAVIHFREGATGNFDTQADALKLQNGTFNLSTLIDDGKKLAINSVAPLSCSSEIKLAVENTTPGSYRLDFAEYESFEQEVVITLEDKFVTSQSNVRITGGYTFSVTAASASFGNNRFVIHFSRLPIDETIAISVADVCAGSAPLVSIPSAQKGIVYSAYTPAGQLLASQLAAGGALNFQLPDVNMPAGTNSIHLHASWPGCTTAVTKSITFNVAQLFSVTLEGERACQKGSIQLTASGAPENGSYNWYDSEATAAVPLAGAGHSASFETPVLSQSKMYFASCVNSLGCEGERKSILAKVIHFDDASIQLSDSGDSLRSNFAEGNQWYFNQQPIAQATQPYIIPNQPGVYTLQVTVDECHTTADYQWALTGTEETYQGGINLFPNPVSKVFTIQIPEDLIHTDEVKILNSWGQTIGQFNLRTQDKIRSGGFDMSSYPSGIYFLQLKSSSKSITVKMIRQ